MSDLNENLSESPGWRLLRGSQLPEKAAVYSAMTVTIATSFVSIILPHNAAVFGRGDSKMTGFTACRNEAFEPSIDIILWSIDIAE